MKSAERIAVLVAALFAVYGLQSSAEAGIITSVATFSTPGFSTGSVGPVGANPAPNNDNATAASPNVIPYNIFFNTLGTLETEFAVANSAGTTEYRITQTFINNTGILWAGFLFELGFGTGANFIGSTISDSLDFDTPTQDPAPMSSAFSTLNHQTDILSWAGGAVPSIGVALFTFAIDVPDDLQDFNQGGVNQFTLRQTPIVAPAAVPEPTSTILVGVGLACLGLVARSRG